MIIMEKTANIRFQKRQGRFILQQEVMIRDKNSLTHKWVDVPCVDRDDETVES